MKKISFLLVVTSLFTLASCGMFNDLNIEKRHYNNDFYVHVRDHRANDETAQPVAADSQDNVSSSSVATENPPPAEKNIPQQATASGNVSPTVENKTASRTAAHPDYNEAVKTHAEGQSS